ncbi:guanine nucleotide exchange factor for Rab-3A [Hydra vulgaris]|uniref:Guanine nucleotide exchange factor for Rab-3A n=1 Tax=Hydra vulgaris TaxID=6087 RepID=A0ABM4BXP7_HYDVU
MSESNEINVAQCMPEILEINNSSSVFPTISSSRNRSRSCLMHLSNPDLYVPSVRSTSMQKECFVNGVNSSSLTDGELSWQSFEKLKSELDRAQQDLRSRDVQCEALSKVRDEVDLEIEELTASLFEEAHKMVFEANSAKAVAEKKLYETQLKLDGLQAEVTALKLLVITSTPANPGKEKKSKKEKLSHQQSQQPEEVCLECETYHWINDSHKLQEAKTDIIDFLINKEVDCLVFQNFLAWLESNCPLKDHLFLHLIHKDDISPCLRFPNEELASSIYTAIQNNMLTVEAIKPKQKKCALTFTYVLCSFRIKTSDTCSNWFFISNSSRARVVAVVDFFMFLRYIRQGIIKKDINVLYWEMIKRRAQMSLTRLGLHNNFENAPKSLSSSYSTTCSSGTSS